VLANRNDIRIWLLAALAAALIIAAVPARATPIRPDLQRLLAEPQMPSQFVPARAGWQGPETPPPPQTPPGPIDSATRSRAVRASIVAAAIPDPWALLAIAAAILFLRWMRLSRSHQPLRPELPEELAHDFTRAA
jgi:hypothetical protein